MQCVRSHFTYENRHSHEGKASFCLVEASFGPAEKRFARVFVYPTRYFANRDATRRMPSRALRAVFCAARRRARTRVVPNEKRGGHAGCRSLGALFRRSIPAAQRRESTAGRVTDGARLPH